jgi:hypothetical protein
MGECGAAVQYFWQGRTDGLERNLSVSLSTTNSTWTGLGISGEKMVTDHQYCMALSTPYSADLYFIFILS